MTQVASGIFPALWALHASSVVAATAIGTYLRPLGLCYLYAPYYLRRSFFRPISDSRRCTEIDLTYGWRIAA